MNSGLAKARAPFGPCVLLDHLAGYSDFSVDASIQLTPIFNLGH